MPVFRPQTVGIAGVTGQCFPSGKREKKKRPKKKICWLLIFQQGVATKRDETRPDFSFVRMSRLLRRLSGRVEARGRPNQVSLSLSRAYRCRAGRLERIRPYLNGSLSLFPSSSSLTTAPPSKHTHTHTLPTTPSHTSSLANSQPSSFLGNASPFSLSACIKTTHVCV